MKKKSKIIVLSCMVALLAVTAIFNFVMTTDVNGLNQNSTTSSTDYFSQYRTERLTSRNEELLQLDNIIAVSEGFTTEKADAISMKTELTAITEKELMLENLIKAYGFADAVVVIGIDSDNINVIAKTPDLTTEDAIKIYSIISEETSVSPDNVKIIPIS